jgi:flavin-dependent dehydrogenase
VLVVGAGPAGLATALWLTRRGIPTLVIERRRGPIDKACGEGIMPAGVRALERLGIPIDRLRAAPFHGVRFIDGRCTVEGRFATGPGLGIRRTELSRALRAAAELAGIRIATGCTLLDFEPRDGGIVARTSSGTCRARLLVGADGLSSAVRTGAGLATPVRSRRFGLRRHFRLAPWSPFVEVHWREDMEAYVTPIAPDEVGVAILGSDGGRDYDRELAGFPSLAARLAGAAPTSEVRGAGPFWQGARDRTASGVALVGDAAGYTDAVTGEGITLALRSGEALAHVFATRGSTSGYDRVWRRMTREHRAFAALLGFAVDHPRARRATFRLLSRAPSLFGTLLRRAASEHAGRSGASGPDLRPAERALD